MPNSEKMQVKYSNLSNAERNGDIIVIHERIREKKNRDRQMTGPETEMISV